jgi:hypothetical protein
VTTSTWVTSFAALSLFGAQEPIEALGNWGAIEDRLPLGGTSRQIRQSAELLYIAFSHELIQARQLPPLLLLRFLTAL